MNLKILTSLTVTALATLTLGCGGSDDSGSDSTGSVAATSSEETDGESGEAATTAVDGADGNVLTVRMSEFAFEPSSIKAKAGPTTISAVNDGNVVHELVILKTDAPPMHLAMTGGEIDESTSVGEVADVEPGATKETTIDLAAGRYVMVCALPGHYEGGMYGSLIVK